MRKLIAILNTGYCGSEEHVAFSVDDDASEDEISEIVYGMALDHADSYGYYPDDDDDFDEDNDGYTYNIEGAWEDYEPEKHDRYRSGGGSFEKDF